MAFIDMPHEKLKQYLPERREPDDFDSFWEKSLNEARSYPLNPVFNKVDYHMKTVETYDVTFNGYNSEPIKGWFIIPAETGSRKNSSGSQENGRLPCVVQYIGYSGGRGFPFDHLVYASAGFAHFVMDTRGQGSSVVSIGDTQDPYGSEPMVAGFMTKGISNPENYYYRRVFVDAVRAVETIRRHPKIDSKRIAVTGRSQGGGITLAVSGLLPDVAVSMPEVPFLCHYRRAMELVDTNPYNEIVTYLKSHRDMVDTVFDTLSYFDGINFAVRAKATALFSAGLMDTTCPPSTVFAAYNYYGGQKEIKVYEFNQHEGGGSFHIMEKLKFLQTNLRLPAR